MMLKLEEKNSKSGFFLAENFPTYLRLSLHTCMHISMTSESLNTGNKERLVMETATVNVLLRSVDFLCE